MKYVIGLVGFLILSFPLWAADMRTQLTPVVRVSVLASGKILLDGKESSLAEIRKAFEAATAKNGSVWYYRENAKAESPPQGMEVVKLVIDNKLPISLSSKPDFSDYIDENGQSHPRK